MRACLVEENCLYNESPCFEEGVGSGRRWNVGFLHTHYCLYMGPATPPASSPSSSTLPENTAEVLV